MATLKSGNDYAFEKRRENVIILLERRWEVRDLRKKKKKKTRKLRNGKRRVMESIRCREAVPDGQRKQRRGVF